MQLAIICIFELPMFGGEEIRQILFMVIVSSQALPGYQSEKDRNTFRA